MHSIFTVTANIVPARLDALRSYLADVQLSAGKHAALPFEKLSKLHFASIVIVPEQKPAFGPLLVVENNVDGTIAAYIEQLCREAPHGLHGMFSACEGYSAGALDVGRLRAYLHSHVVLPNAAFVANVGRDAARIKREAALVESIETFADGSSSSSRTPPSRELYRDVRAHVAATDGWALQPKIRLAPAELRRRRARALALLPPALMLLPYAPLLCAIVLGHELREQSDDGTLDSAHVERVTAAEDRSRQNHFASVTVVKPGIFRRTLLRLVLGTIDRVAGLSTGGTLSNLDNIHFAHWVLLDRGRRLMFLTNYDGSWENYLDDFIDKASFGLTAIWSNVCGFPKTRLLVFGGAQDERNFKAIARRTQIPTAVFYSAYPDLAVATIDNNSAIRDGLAEPPEDADIDRWLQRL